MCDQIAGAESTLTAFPINTAVLSGDATTMNCTSSSGYSTELSWKFGTTAIATSCSGASGPYSLDYSNPGQCNLIVNNANSSLSGYYQCLEYPSLDSMTAMLTVIGEFLVINV